MKYFSSRQCPSCGYDWTPKEQANPLVNVKVIVINPDCDTCLEMARRGAEAILSSIGSDMAKDVIRNEAGEPFSKWQPADKFAHQFRVRHPDVDGYMVPEFKFSLHRNWRMDFAFPKFGIGVEIDGFANYGKAGRHQRPKGQEDDNEKLNYACDLGWRVYRYNSRQLGSMDGVIEAVEQVAAAVCGAMPTPDKI